MTAELMSTEDRSTFWHSSCCQMAQLTRSDRHMSQQRGPMSQKAADRDSAGCCSGCISSSDVPSEFSMGQSSSPASFWFSGVGETDASESLDEMLTSG